MKRGIVVPLCALLAAAFVAAAGCQGIPVPYEPVRTPAQTSAPSAPTPTPVPQTPTPTPDTSPSPTPSPTLTPSVTPSALPTDTPSASPTPTETPTLSVSPSPLPETPSPTPTLSPSPTPAKTPVPTATPSPAQTPPAHAGDRKDVQVQQYYDPKVPDGLTVALEYTKYAAPQYYFVVLKTADVRELPKSGAKALKRVAYSNRLEMLAKVLGSDGKSTWYRVRVGKIIGYVPSSAGSPRSFQLDKALKRIKLLEQIADKPDTVRIHNYNNVHGLPPKIGGKTVDPYGIPRDQSAPAYLAPNTKSSFRYIPDGMLCELIATAGKFSEVYVPYWDEVRYVPSPYIYNKDAATKTPDVIKKLTQVVVVDRSNQNIVTFEERGGKWTVISMCFVSTGKKGGYYQPTPLGDFFTDKRPAGKLGIGEFWFMADGVDETDPNAKYEGYAPYAIRFTSGAYLHGLPVGVSYGADGKVNFTGRTIEAASFLGVQPESHMCVRNYTSHAKFMYKWITDGNAAVIVID